MYRPGSNIGNRSRWSRPTALWWVLGAVLIAANIAIALFLWLRSPETEIRWADTPVDQAVAGELTQLQNRQTVLRPAIEELNAVIDNGECPVLEAWQPNNQAALKKERNALLGGSTESRPGDSSISGDNSPAISGQPIEKLSREELVAKLRASTVLILIPLGGKIGTGTGFLVAPDAIVTNRHVVEKSQTGEVYIASQHLGGLLTGKVQSMSSSSAINGPDFALIRTEPITNSQALALTPRHAALTPVISAGYPGLSIASDSGFQDLIAGNTNAAPPLVTTRGEIQAVKKPGNGRSVLQHSAEILMGNSGGPLVDSCGRVVGVNTFITVDDKQAARLSHALLARDLETFLTANGQIFKTSSAVCADQ